MHEDTSSPKKYILLGLTVTLTTITLLFLVLSISTPRLAGALVHAMTGSDRLALIAGRGHSDVYVRLGSQYLGGKQAYSAVLAEKYFDEALRRDPKNYFATYQLARVMFVEGDFPAAQAYIEQSILLAPDFNRNYYMQGLIYGFSQEYEKAESGFKEFIAREPNIWAGYVDLSWVYFAQGKYSEGLALLEPKADHFANIPWFENAYGLFLMHTHEYAQAREHFEAARSALAAMSPEEWGVAYPGNDPSFFQEGYMQMQNSIEQNMKLVDEIMPK